MNNETIKTVNELVKILDQCLLGDEITLSINRMKQLLDYITNLQQENQDIKDTLQDKLDYIGHLKELCDKYEEEHNTEFKIWKDERCQLLDYKTRCKKAIKHIKEYCIDDEFYINLTNKEKNIIDVLNILQDGE